MLLNYYGLAMGEQVSCLVSLCTDRQHFLEDIFWSVLPLRIWQTMCRVHRALVESVVPDQLPALILPDGAKVARCMRATTTRAHDCDG